MKIHKPIDKSLRNLSTSFPQGLFDRMGIDVKVLEVLDCNLYTDDYKNIIVDLLVSLDDNSIAVAEFHNSYITRATSTRYAKYILYASDKYEKDCKLYIIYTAKCKINYDNFKPLTSLAIVPCLKSFSETDGDNVLARIISKLECGDELTDEDFFDLGAITLYSTKENNSDFALKVTETILKIEEKYPKEFKEISTVHLMLIHKTVEDEIVKNKIRELLKMKNPILEAEREEGRKEGIEEGRIEGAIKKEKEFIKNMLAEGCSLEFVSRISGRSVKELSCF